MENASKALLIAGGVLLAVIIISVMVYVYAHMQSLERTKEEVLKAEELSKFNMEFESYNKKSMYGTDIISVINKAIAYNDKYGTALINIVLHTSKDFEKVEKKWKTNASGQDEQLENNTTVVLTHGDYNISTLKSFIGGDDKKSIEYSYDGRI